MVQQTPSTTDVQQRPYQTQGAESEIRKVVEQINAAFRAGDVDKLMSFYADEIVSYDMPTPLSYKGIDSYRRSWQMGIDMMKDMGPLETAEDKYFINGDLAVYHALCRMTGTLKKTDEKIDAWSRYTGVFKKIGDRWLIVHEHFSVPIEMEQEKPAWNLKPEDSSMRH